MPLMGSADSSAYMALSPTGYAPIDPSAQQMQQMQRKPRFLDQVLAQRQGAQQQNALLQQAGPEFMDQLDQRRMDPMNTWF